MKTEIHTGTVDELIEVARLSGVHLLWMCRRITVEGVDGWDFCDEDEDGYHLTPNLTLPFTHLCDLKCDTIALVSVLVYDAGDMAGVERRISECRALCLIVDNDDGCGPDSPIYSHNTGEITLNNTGSRVRTRSTKEASLTLYLRR